MSKVTLDVSIGTEKMMKALEESIHKEIDKVKERLSEKIQEDFRSEVTKILAVAGLQVTKMMRINHFGQDITFSINLNDIRDSKAKNDS